MTRLAGLCIINYIYIANAPKDERHLEAAVEHVEEEELVLGIVASFVHIELTLCEFAYSKNN